MKPEGCPTSGLVPQPTDNKFKVLHGCSWRTWCSDKWWWKTWQAAAFPRFLASIVNILARLFTHYSRTVVYRPFPSFSAPYARYGSWWEIREGNGIRREWDEWVNEWEKHVVRSVQSRRLSSYSLRIPSQPCLSSHPFLSSFHPYGARFVSFLRLTFTP